MVDVVATMKAKAAMNTVTVTTATAQQAVGMVATGYHMGSTWHCLLNNKSITELHTTATATVVILTGRLHGPGAQRSQQTQRGQWKQW